MRKVFLFILSLPIISFITLEVKAELYEINPAKSQIRFVVKHMGNHKVYGSFQEFKGSFSYEPGISDSVKSTAEIQAKSIKTGIRSRDEHLRSNKFLNVENYPLISFSSHASKESGANQFKIFGKLTMHGKTKEIELDAKTIDSMVDKDGKGHLLIEASALISRKDFGLVWNHLIEAGHLVGDDIIVLVKVDGVKK